MVSTKGGFFSESEIRFSNLPISQKNYPELEIWISCLLIWAGISNFKIRIVFWNNFFWKIGRFEKRISLSEKKHLYLNNGNKINPLHLVSRRGFYQTKNSAKVGLPLYSSA